MEEEEEEEEEEGLEANIDDCHEHKDKLPGCTSTYFVGSIQLGTSTIGLALRKNRPI
jgi:hypothetical protein